MIREAELFVMAEQVLVEVLGRIRPEHWKIVIPRQFASDDPMSLRQAVDRYARENAEVPDVLAGRTTADVGHDPFDGELHGDLARISKDACAAAQHVADRDVLVHAAGADLPAGDYLWRLTIARSFLAHDVAIHLGSRACPLTEELARGLCDGTAAAAPMWRSLGVFGEPLPLPAHVSWRDRFLLSAGRDPHPLH